MVRNGVSLFGCFSAIVDLCALLASVWERLAIFLLLLQNTTYVYIICFFRKSCGLVHSLLLVLLNIQQKWVGHLFCLHLPYFVQAFSRFFLISFILHGNEHLGWFFMCSFSNFRFKNLFFHLAVVNKEAGTSITGTTRDPCFRIWSKFINWWFIQ